MMGGLDSDGKASGKEGRWWDRLGKGTEDRQACNACRAVNG